MSELQDTELSARRGENARNNGQAAVVPSSVEDQIFAVLGLKSVTYTSHARLDLDSADLESIHRGARVSNALNAVTGILIFNGTHFLQIIEGPDEAIDALMQNLYRDRRHSALEVRDARKIEVRSFADWSMELVWVETNFHEAKEMIFARIPSTVSTDVRDRIERFTSEISRKVRLA